jgi:hypothetical protein
MTKGLPYSMSRGDARRQEIIKLAIPIRALSLSIESVGAAIAFGTAVIAGLPEGFVNMLGAVAQLEISGPVGSADLTDTWNGDFAVGRTATTDLTLDGTDVDVIPSTAIGPAVAEVSPVTKGLSAGALAGTIFDNTDGSLELNLNLIVDAADVVDDKTVVMTVEGVLHVTYIVMGDD